MLNIPYGEFRIQEVPFHRNPYSGCPFKGGYGGIQEVLFRIQDVPVGLLSISLTD